MPVTKLRIVVASPGDVKAERNILEEVAEELNRGVGAVLQLRKGGPHRRHQAQVWATSVE